MSSSTTSRESREQARSSCSASITKCFCVSSCAQTRRTRLVPEARGGAGRAGLAAHLEAGGLVQVEQVQEDAVQLATEVSAQVGQQPQQCVQDVHAVRP